MQTAQPFTYAQQPTAISPNTRKNQKYRDPHDQPEIPSSKTFANLMWNKRVFRGNTYAAQIVSITEQQEAELQRKREKSERRRLLKAELLQQQMQQQQAQQRSLTPRPVEGRKHLEIQTEKYLEEIQDRVIEEDISTQTDPFMDRPASPLYMPKKSGIDKETQIEEDLFDFDLEVEPILSVLVGKTLEQSMLEVLEEEEQRELMLHQLEFEQKRNAEIAEIQRLEAEEKRKYEEKERLKEQERKRLIKEKEIRDKQASRELAKLFIKNLEVKTFATLEREGYFYDVVEREVTESFMPWLMEEVNNNVDKRKAAQMTVDNLIREAIRAMVQ